MDQRVRITAGLAVLAVGALLALVFGRPGRVADTSLPSSGEQLMLRKRDAPPAAPTGASAAGALEPSRLPAMLKPAETGALAPDSVRLHPVGDPLTTSRWGVSLGMMLPETGRSPASETHKIADGDTLPGLAERYLGSADRAMELFEANREVLASPQLLPIGVELRIPPRQVSGPGPAAGMPDRPLVPVEKGLGIGD